MKYIIQPGGSLQGAVKAPGDKSISHRALLLAAIGNGTSKIKGFLEGEDNLRTLQALQEMGVVIERPSSGVVTVQGVGLRGLRAPSRPLDMGNSGTAMRLLMGLLAAQSFDSVLVGDASLSRRPMERVAIPLRMMGANISTQQGVPPVWVKGSALHGIAYTLPVASAQIKSAVLLAGLYATGVTEVIEPGMSRDHTERLLKAFSYPVEQTGNRIQLTGGGALIGHDVPIPGDFSSALFFIVGALIAKGAHISIKGVGINPTRLGALHILRAMGADIRVEQERCVGQEPVADILVRSSSLRGITIPMQWVSSAMDEFPALMVAAACATGKTLLQGAHELRLKESDRIKTVVEGLTRLGVNAQETQDGMTVVGGQLQGGIIDSQGDHRVAMAFAMAALGALFELQIENCQNVSTSFPTFVPLAATLGLRIQIGE